MVEKTIYRLLKHRHFWRDVSFDELSEIYVSMLFRSLAISLTGIFVPLYLLKLHYSLAAIMMLFFWYFLMRSTFSDMLAGHLCARLGPKHTMLISYIILAVYSIGFATLPTFGWPLWLLGAIGGAATSLFAIPYHVDFSKVKHRAHGGKELGYASMMEKGGAILGPIISGVVATLFGGQYIFAVAVILLLFGGLPLLRTPEPIPPRQHVTLSLLNLPAMRRDIVSFIFNGLELTLCGNLWPMYLGIFILTSGAAYAKLGFVASLSVVVSMSMAYVIGRSVDAHHGRSLLRFGATANAFIHVLRPFVHAFPAALATNIANEGVTVAYRIPYTKGMYDAGDDRLPARRITYFMTMEMTSSIGKASIWLFLAACCGIMDRHLIFVVGFGLAAASSLLMMTERFPALNPKSEPAGTVYHPAKTVGLTLAVQNAQRVAALGISLRHSGHLRVLGSGVVLLRLEIATK